MKYTTDIAVLMITFAICTPMIMPIISAGCMTGDELIVYEKITMAGIAILAGYLGGIARVKLEK
jgi:hypothetical protein